MLEAKINDAVSILTSSIQKITQDADSDTILSSCTSDDSFNNVVENKKSNMLNNVKHCLREEM